MNSFRPHQDIKKIIHRYLTGRATADEMLFLEAYYKFLENSENTTGIGNAEEIPVLDDENFKAIQRKIALAKKPTSIPFYKYASAAAILLMICGGFYFLFKAKIHNKETAIAKTEKLDVLPGANKAILTLGDGTEIILDDLTAKNISERNGIKIAKTKGGQVVYTIINQSHIAQQKNIAYNTIQTPKGGQYQVVLPDGSKVWLNAASSLKFPEIFVGDTRNVVLKGEAYFEVSKNKTMPFHVKSLSQDIEVLGTHFNVNSYLDNGLIQTTLLEGRVKVSNQNTYKILGPGEQALTNVSTGAPIQLAGEVDVDDVMAWKNGLFQFNDADLQIVLYQLERWYDIKIDYSSLPKKRYTGMVPRSAKLSEVLKMLEKTGNIKFEITEGRKLKVLQ